MKMKRIAALFLAALMLIPVFCVSAHAADEVAIDSYTSTSYTDQKKKVDTMEMMYRSDEYGYEMYFDRKSGEFALKNLKTGEYVFSNPYDVAVNTKTNDAHRQALLSQIILSYTDVETQKQAYSTPSRTQPSTAIRSLSKRLQTAFVLSMRSAQSNRSDLFLII